MSTTSSWRLGCTRSVRICEPTHWQGWAISMPRSPMLHCYRTIIGCRPTAGCPAATKRISSRSSNDAQPQRDSAKPEIGTNERSRPGLPAQPIDMKIVILARLFHAIGEHLVHFVVGLEGQHAGAHGRQVFRVDIVAGGDDHLVAGVAGAGRRAVQDAAAAARL